ncbi:MAG TPA: hypothetical protein VLL52_07675 [Anaerolineae bacterium]|nr:hypothetical protein [Anaerolineae bacterium]
MTQKDTTVPAGWKGGFAQSNPKFEYVTNDPNRPDLTDIDLLGNLDNIDKITRQQSVYWPEFSWLTVMNDETSRCFQRFAHDISRIGYDDTGRVWSIVCPQQGTYIPHLANLNVEVTVTSQRGWVDEPNKTLAADMSVQGKIWFTPDVNEDPILQEIWELFDKHGLPFPGSKEHAIKVNTHKVGDRNQPVFPVRKGLSKRFTPPVFSEHYGGSWMHGNIDVQIGAIELTHHPVVDMFNRYVLRIFNEGVGNMLQEGNILTWNVWFTAPELADTEEWETHAEKWRESIDVNHAPPNGSLSSEKRYADGTVYVSPLSAEIDRFKQEAEVMLHMIKAGLRFL